MPPSFGTVTCAEGTVCHLLSGFGLTLNRTMDLRATLGSTIVGMQLVLAAIVGVHGILGGASAFAGYSLCSIVCAASLLAAVGVVSQSIGADFPADGSNGATRQFLRWMTRLAGVFVLLGLGFARFPTALWLVVALFFLGADFLGRWISKAAVVKGVSRQTLVSDAMPRDTDDSEAMTSPQSALAADESPVPTFDQEPGCGDVVVDEDERIDESAEELSLSHFDEWMDQRITRSLETPDGDIFHAVVRCRFSPHQQNGTVHIGFCPPFRAIPEITVRAIDGPDARIAMGETLAWGARIDIHLKHDDPGPSSCVFEVLAHVAPAPII